MSKEGDPITQAAMKLIFIKANPLATEPSPATREQVYAVMKQFDDIWRKINIKPHELIIQAEQRIKSLVEPK